VPPGDPEIKIPSIEIPDSTLETIVDSDFNVNPGLDDNRKQDLLSLLLRIDNGTLNSG
jgi:hypothetical protein